jgi:phosphatidylglycerol:prolipoprotein diacylglycerol transferase
MRPRLVDALSAALGSELAGGLVPAPATMYAVAMIAVLVVFVRRSHRLGISSYHGVGAALWSMAAGVVGARAAYLAVHLQRTLADPAQILDLGGGTASWGAYLGGALGLLLYCRRHRLPAGLIADALASCLALGVALGRWSCFLNGDDYGRLSSLPWAVRYPPGSYPFVAQVRAGLLDPRVALSLPVHPVQLYLSLNGLMLFAGMSLLWPRLRNRPGALFGLYWVAYGATRFFWEFARGDQPNFLHGSLTAGQVICIAIVVGAGLWLKVFILSDKATEARSACHATGDGARTLEHSKGGQDEVKQSANASALTGFWCEIAPGPVLGAGSAPGDGGSSEFRTGY